MNISIPKPIEDKLIELDAILEKHKDGIPVNVAATFLNAKREGLQSFIESGKCPFGIMWQNEVTTLSPKGRKVGVHLGKRAFKIPIVPFYAWYTHGIVFQALAFGAVEEKNKPEDRKGSSKNE